MPREFLEPIGGFTSQTGTPEEPEQEQERGFWDTAARYGMQVLDAPAVLTGLRAGLNPNTTYGQEFDYWWNRDWERATQETGGISQGDRWRNAYEQKRKAAKLQFGSNTWNPWELMPDAIQQPVEDFLIEIVGDTLEDPAALASLGLASVGKGLVKGAAKSGGKKLLSAVAKKEMIESGIGIGMMGYGAVDAMRMANELVNQGEYEEAAKMGVRAILAGGLGAHLLKRNMPKKAVATDEALANVSNSLLGMTEQGVPRTETGLPADLSGDLPWQAQAPTADPRSLAGGEMAGDRYVIDVDQNMYTSEPKFASDMPAEDYVPVTQGEYSKILRAMESTVKTANKQLKDNWHEFAHSGEELGGDISIRFLRQIEDGIEDDSWARTKPFFARRTPDGKPEIVVKITPDNEMVNAIAHGDVLANVRTAIAHEIAHFLPGGDLAQGGRYSASAGYVDPMTGRRISEGVGGYHGWKEVLPEGGHAGFTPTSDPLADINHMWQRDKIDALMQREDSATAKILEKVQKRKAFPGNVTIESASYRPDIAQAARGLGMRSTGEGIPRPGSPGMRENPLEELVEVPIGTPPRKPAGTSDAMVIEHLRRQREEGVWKNLSEEEFKSELNSTLQKYADSPSFDINKSAVKEAVLQKSQRGKGGQIAQDVRDSVMARRREIRAERAKETPVEEVIEAARTRVPKVTTEEVSASKALEDVKKRTRRGGDEGRTFEQDVADLETAAAAGLKGDLADFKALRATFAAARERGFFKNKGNLWDRYLNALGSITDAKRKGSRLSATNKRQKAGARAIMERNPGMSFEDALKLHLEGEGKRKSLQGKYEALRNVTRREERRGEFPTVRSVKETIVSGQQDKFTKYLQNIAKHINDAQKLLVEAQQAGDTVKRGLITKQIERLKKIRMRLIERRLKYQDTQGIASGGSTPRIEETLEQAAARRKALRKSRITGQAGENITDYSAIKEEYLARQAGPAAPKKEASSKRVIRRWLKREPPPERPKEAGSTIVPPDQQAQKMADSYVRAAEEARKELEALKEQSAENIDILAGEGEKGKGLLYKPSIRGQRLSNPNLREVELNALRRLRKIWQNTQTAVRGVTMPTQAAKTQWVNEQLTISMERFNQLAEQVQANQGKKSYRQARKLRKEGYELRDVVDDYVDGIEIRPDDENVEYTFVAKKEKELRARLRAKLEREADTTFHRDATPEDKRTRIALIRKAQDEIKAAIKGMRHISPHVSTYRALNDRIALLEKYPQKRALAPEMGKPREFPRGTGEGGQGVVKAAMVLDTTDLPGWHGPKGVYEIPYGTDKWLSDREALVHLHQQIKEDGLKSKTIILNEEPVYERVMVRNPDFDPKRKVSETNPKQIETARVTDDSFKAIMEELNDAVPNWQRAITTKRLDVVVGGAVKERTLTRTKNITVSGKLKQARTSAAVDTGRVRPDSTREPQPSLDTQRNIEQAGPTRLGKEGPTAEQKAERYWSSLMEEAMSEGGIEADFRASKALSSAIGKLKGSAEIFPYRLFRRDKKGKLFRDTNNWTRLKSAIADATGDQLEKLKQFHKDALALEAIYKKGRAVDVPVSLEPRKGATAQESSVARLEEPLGYHLEENDITGKIENLVPAEEGETTPKLKQVIEGFKTSAQFNDFVSAFHIAKFGKDFGSGASQRQVVTDRLLRRHWNRVKPDSQRLEVFKTTTKAVGTQRSNRRLVTAFRKAKRKAELKAYMASWKERHKGIFKTEDLATLKQEDTRKFAFELDKAGLSTAATSKKVAKGAKLLALGDESIGSEATAPRRHHWSREDRELIKQLPEDVQKALKGWNPNDVPMVGGWLGHVGGQAGSGLSQAGQLSRTLMSSFDISNPGRQSLMIVTSHPVDGVKRIAEMLRSAKNEAAHAENMKSVTEDPVYALSRVVGLNLPHSGKETFEYAGGDIIRKISKEGVQIEGHAIPGTKQLGQLVNIGTSRSENTYVYYQAKSMIDLFKHLMKQGIEIGALGPHVAQADQLTFLRDIATYVNTAGSRARIKNKSAKKIAEFGFFSPQMIKSRVEALADLITFGGRYQTKAARKLVRKEYARSIAGISALTGVVYTGLKMMGEDPEVELDPRSTDFMKIRAGDVRIDTLGGFQQYIRFGAQMATGERKETTTGQIRKAPRLENLMRFIRSKAAPLPGAGYDWLKGSGVAGKPPSAGDLVMPLGLGDIKEISKEDPQLAAIMALPIMLGIGAQSYSQGGNWRNYDEATSIAARKVYKELETLGIRGPRPGRRIKLSGKDALGRPNYYTLSRKEYEEFEGTVMPKVTNILSSFINSPGYKNSTEESRRKKLYALIRKLNKRFGAAKQGGKKWIKDEPEPNNRWNSPRTTKFSWD